MKNTIIIRIDDLKIFFKVRAFRNKPINIEVRWIIMTQRDFDIFERVLQNYFYSDCRKSRIDH